MESKLLKESEAAEHLRLSIYTLREVRKAGLISHIQFSDKTIRYTAEHLEEYEQKHLKPAA